MSESGTGTDTGRGRGRVVEFIPDFRGKAVTVHSHRHYEMSNSTEYRIEGLNASEMAALRNFMFALHPCIRTRRIVGLDFSRFDGVEVEPILDMDPTEIETQLNAIRFALVRDDPPTGTEHESTTSRDTYTKRRVPILINKGDVYTAADSCFVGKFNIHIDATHSCGNGVDVYTTHLKFQPSAVHTERGVSIEPIHYPSNGRAAFHERVVGTRKGQKLFHVPHGCVLKICLEVGPGIGQIHSRWSPLTYGGFVRVSGTETVQIEDKGAPEDSPLRQMLKEHCPASILDIEDMAHGGKLFVKRGEEEKCTSCALCKKSTDQHTGGRIKVSLGIDSTESASGGNGSYLFRVGYEGEFRNDSGMSSGIRMLEAASKIRETSGRTVLEEYEHRKSTSEDENAMMGIIGYSEITPGMVEVANRCMCT